MSTNQLFNKTCKVFENLAKFDVSKLKMSITDSNGDTINLKFDSESEHNCELDFDIFLSFLIDLSESVETTLADHSSLLHDYEEDDDDDFLEYGDDYDSDDDYDDYDDYDDDDDD